MRLMRRFRFLVMTMALILTASSAFAYTDEIRDITPDEAWRATLKVLGPKGVKKADEKKRIVQSNWVEDEVVRRNELFKGITSQIYRRRTKMKVTITENPRTVEVQIKGTFEEKPQQSAVQAPWRKFKPQIQDYDLERTLFMRILTQIAQDHN